MFGYVTAARGELRVAEYEFYRAAYCGLCRANGRCTGQCSRMALSYDFTFLALVRMALVGEEPSFKKAWCLAHPFGRRAVMLPNNTLDFCARAAGILIYHKLRDDIDDERGAKRLRARLALPFASAARRRAKKKLSGLDGRVSEHLLRLAEIEGRREPTVDLPATVFGELVADILSEGLEGTSASLARLIGLHIGKWIYIADALDDYESDREAGRYNPFSLMWIDGIDENARQGILAAMTGELADAESGFDLLDLDRRGRLGGVIKNIIYCGMPRRAAALGKPDGKESHKYE